MKIKINDAIPDNMEFFCMTKEGPEKINSNSLFNNSKVILVGVPGAFTPTCSADHLPGFIEKKDFFFSKGIDKIFFISVNDPFVMDEWRKSKSEEDIIFLADPSAIFAQKTELKIDLSVIGLGIRLSRFAMIIENGIVKNLFDEGGGGLDVSTADSLSNSI
tara:strand:- start:427 stop:909 length:483 start_codon:yes stop_codon:yes gene_type:complete